MEFEAFSSRDAASRAAAGYLETALRRHLRQHGQAALAVSGGSSPEACFRLLAQAELPWNKVKITLTDERSTPVTDAASNEGMLRRSLLTRRAAAAEFVPLQPGALERLPRPCACTLAGMGEDGHFASIFPDHPDLSSALSPDNQELCFPVTTRASSLPRVSMSLAMLLQSAVIYLLAFGAAKRAIIEAPGGLPVAALLTQQRTPVHVLWAPQEPS